MYSKAIKMLLNERFELRTILDTRPSKNVFLNNKKLALLTKQLITNLSRDLVNKTVE